jgi:hypothetical protein
LAVAQTPPRDTTIVADTGLPIHVDLRIQSKSERDRNLRCNSLEAAQISSLSGCAAGFLPPELSFLPVIRSAGTIRDRFHVNVDYDGSRQFDASNVFSLYYEGSEGSRLKRVDIGNISFAAPSSRFLTSSLPSGNYGFQAIAQLGRLQFKSIFAQQTSNAVPSRRFLVNASRANQTNERDVEDRAIEPRRFFFTVDPILFGKAYPNIDILNRSQLQALRNALPDTLRPTRVLLYRVQFGTQPQNPNGPQFRLQGDAGRGHQTYDLLREGVDYFMDGSMLWFALTRELNEVNERLVVAYNVRLNGRDTTWVTTGGTPDLQVIRTRDQVANLVWEPNLAPSSPAFRREIRSVYRLAGEDLVRSSTQVRVVTGSGLLEHPIAGPDPTFLQMFLMSKPTNPAEFDYDNRVWPRATDAVFNLGAGAPDVRGGQTTDAARLFRDHFIIFPSLKPFSARDSGLVVQGNPTNDAIYTTPGEYLYSTQHPASIYRLRLRYQTAGTESGGVINIGATQMRPGSERVVLEGRPLVRDLDYRIDYDIGRIEFLRPDTLFRNPRNVDVSYEDNPGFAATPTTLAGIVTELPFRNGTVSFSAINQSQSTPFTRPQLGFQAYSTLTTGLTAQFSWDAPMLTELVNRLPFVQQTKAASHFSVQGEIASSHPQFAAHNQGSAFVETFDGTTGTAISLGDIGWSYSSMPAYGHTLRGIQFGPSLFEPSRASTLVWQTYVQTASGRRIQFTRSNIDPLAEFAGTGAEPNETLLWLTLLPLDQGGRTTTQFKWNTPSQPGRRWRSIRTVLRPSGIDLTGSEQLEFWTLADTNSFTRRKNPTMILDFGDISENAIRFAPETLTIVRNSNGAVDSVFSGKKLQGFDSLDTERDKFSHTFNADANDVGLPGDIIDTLVVIDGANSKRVTNVPICRGASGALDFLGDPRTNCTRANARLDEEDIDLDNDLNLPNALRENERIFRYVVDLSDPNSYKRVGGSYTDTIVVRGVPQERTRRWVLVSVPFKTPTDSLNDVNRRRIRALRLTLVSGVDQEDEEPTQLPVAELRVTGAPWLVRSSSVLTGIAGVRPNGGVVIGSTIGTNDSSKTLVYQPPPGITNSIDSRGAQFGGVTEINEHSMRIQAVNLPLYHRAETFFRFPTGPQDFFAYQHVRIWGRGRGAGWGLTGELQMYLKIGRDENNFYLYRSPVGSGNTAAAWNDLDIDMQRFVNLRKRIQADYLAGKPTSIACTGVDSAIVVASPLPVGVVAHRFAACDGGYMVYTDDPAVTAPNLVAVQEMAVGLVRVGAQGGSSAILPSDTLELWVDDIRLDHQVNNTGYAGQIGFTLTAGDLADFRVNISNRDPNFRALGEQPTFLSERQIDVSSTIRLDKLLPEGLGLALPLTITKSSIGNDPLYLSQSDIAGNAIPGLRKPENNRTIYSLTVRRTTPVAAGVLGPLLNNLSATGAYVSGVDRTEYQDGRARNFSFGIDYLLTSDSARTVHVPGWLDGTLGALPGAMQAGPIGALRGSAFRWNPTQVRFTTGIVNADDRRLSYIEPAGAVSDQPSVSTAKSRLWKNGGVVELRPTNGLTARWELESSRDLRDYGDSTVASLVTTQQRRSLFGANAGFERERTMGTSISFAPQFSSWFKPRGDIGTQYDMLRDPNVRSLVALPGVIGVDSVLATRDSMLTAPSLTLPRRMIAAQTINSGLSIDLARAFAAYTRDSSTIHRLGSVFAPIDVSYSRSLLSALDAAPTSAPLLLQLGLGGPPSFRRVNGIDATTAGRTGTFSASSALLLPYGTSFVNRYRHTTTQNWISRPDGPQSEVNGDQTQFPDVAFRWGYRPSDANALVANADASVGYVRSDVTVSLPSLMDGVSPEVRRTHQETYPLSGSLAWGDRGKFSTATRVSLTRRVDSLPGSVAKTRGNEMSIDAGRAFHIPESWGLGLRNDIRARVGVQQSHNTTFVIDPSGSVRSRLQDNGRQSFNLTADSNVNATANLTLQGSYVVTFDNNVNHKFAQTIFSVVLQLQVFGNAK